MTFSISIWLKMIKAWVKIAFLQILADFGACYTSNFSKNSANCIFYTALLYDE